MAGQVPYDTGVTEAMVRGLSVPEYDHGPVTAELKKYGRASKPIWRCLRCNSGERGKAGENKDWRMAEL